MKTLKLAVIAATLFLLILLPPIPKAQAEPTKILVVEIDGPITSGTVELIREALEEADDGYEALVLRLTLQTRSPVALMNILVRATAENAGVGCGVKSKKLDGALRYGEKGEKTAWKKLDERWNRIHLSGIIYHTFPAHFHIFCDLIIKFYFSHIIKKDIFCL